MTDTVCFINVEDLSVTGAGHFKFGVPLAKGQYSATSLLQLKTADGPLPDSFCKITQLWPDGSIKWLLCEGLIDNDKHALQAELNSTQVADVDDTHDETNAPLKFLELCISTDKCCDQFTLFKNEPVRELKDELHIDLVSGQSISVQKNKPLALSIEESLSSSIVICDEDNVAYTQQDFSYELIRNKEQYVAVQVKQQYTITFSSGKSLNCAVFATVFLSDGTVTADVSITNPNSATHPDGKWDLGDTNSILLQAVSLQIFADERNTNALSLNGQEFAIPYNVESHLYQASSGFSNWQSPIHVDKTNTVTLPFKGFQLKQGGEITYSGDQADPTVKTNGAANSESGIYIDVANFWQNFPSSIKQKNNCLSISLLGAETTEGTTVPLTELQPGEQKTRTLFISPRKIDRIGVRVNPEHIVSTKVLPFLTNSESALQPLINNAVSGDSSFFNKRLEIDEFGWRNYGELYADHESALASNEPNFVSHYNNQYDPIFGMLCQWLVSGDIKWYELADALAKHVADIDVYHTQLDKPEYSGGLFWHTDHYVQAYTATHRTYSMHQPTGVYDDHAGGGGPGGQHCYTNGLTLHYLLTGYWPSKAAALSITNWVTNYYEGDGTLLGGLLALKNSGLPGVKNVKTGKYPLDRGTGNYIQALLDRFELQGDLSDIEFAAHIIKNTISDKDTFETLSDIEGTWFYTVLLQSVCRFISVKEQIEQFDSDHQYAVNSLVHYAKWMTKNEYAYLDKPDVLEFPNQTWSAQDLRKLCVLSFASNYMSSANAAEAINKATSLEKTIYERLANSDESKTTRILCLMMQNGNYMAYRNAVPVSTDRNTTVKTHNAESNDVSTKISSVRHLLLHLRKFSIAKERSQLVKRFPQFQKWLGKP